MQGSDVAWPARIGQRAPSAVSPRSAAVDDFHNVDASRLRTDIDGSKDSQRSEIEDLDRARFGCHPFDGDERVAIIR